MVFATPSEAPASDGWKFATEENIGSLFVIEPKSEEEKENEFGPGTVTYIVADITEIDEDDPTESETHTDVWIFQKWVQGAIRHLISDGGMALGRLGQDADKGRGKNAAWILEDPDEDDIETATEWLNSRSRAALGGDKKKSKKKK